MRQFDCPFVTNTHNLFGVFHFFFSLDHGSEKDAKLATFQEKRNPLVLILRNCLEKLENLRSKGAANDMREVNEQRNIVKVKTCAKIHDIYGMILSSCEASTFCKRLFFQGLEGLRWERFQRLSPELTILHMKRILNLKNPYIHEYHVSCGLKLY